MIRQVISTIAICFLAVTGCISQQHPSLILTQAGIKDVRAGLGTNELFDQVLEDAIAEVDAEILNGVEVPIPRDMAGGYTHERHKRNFFVLQMAGNLYQITEDDKYAEYIKETLMAYAKMYPTLPLHPTQKSYATGKIFWQCLNDANWLVYVSQAYDAIYDYLKPKERKFLEKDLFRPMADFLSLDNPKFFNRIHNHSTWANAAVGMIALVMNDMELVNRALYGMPIDEALRLEKDNDGGFIYKEGMLQAGFLAQLDGSFAPDGYFTEGPYYLRYAIFPFLIFSKALSNNMPELDIMNYRDGIMTKAIYALLNQTDANGQFFPLNDSQKGMSWNARELVTAVDILYSEDPSNKTLLDIARRQNKVLLDDTGYAVAAALKRGEAQPYTQQPMIYTDGEDGTQGGIGILRNKETCLVMKYSAQGMGHGHFDKLSYSLYDESGEVIQDYGSSRWVNIDQKGGGRYLKENKTFAKQSIAHNTVVIDETSHYEGKIEKGELHHPYLYYADLDNLAAQIVIAKDTNAYPGVELQRTLLLLTDASLPNPLTVDLFRVASDQEILMDLPLWFQGQILGTDFKYQRQLDQLNTLGTSHGYQHLWHEATGQPDNSGANSLTWFEYGKFYTSTFTTESTDKLILGRLGANDPEYNLRNDQVLIHRKERANSGLYASVIESHGTYDPISEIPINPYSDIVSLTVLLDTPEYTSIRLETESTQGWIISIANQSNSLSQLHEVSVGSETFTWSGPYQIKRTKNQ